LYWQIFLFYKEKITNEEKQQIEQDVLEIIGIEDDTKPVILDLESIRILQPGKYELDIVELFKGKPLVYRVEEGKYIIDLASTFGSKGNKNSS
jgi:predicted  nucleic acid-binding Zn-ribbon protein